jgi:lysophospholipase
MLNATSDVVFPYIPDQQTYLLISLFTYSSFVNLGLNSRPTFFGCNASNYTSFSRIPPLVIYFPHTGWTAFTNFSTFTLEYTNADVAAYIDNGVATAVIPLLFPNASFSYKEVNDSHKEIVRHGRLVLPVQSCREQKNE